MDTAGAPVADGDTPIRTLLRTTDLDEARAFCRRLFYGAIEVRPTGAAGLAFAGEVVQIGPVTIGDISYGTEICLAGGDLQAAYHVLAPLTGGVYARLHGVVTTADVSRAAVFRPVGDIDQRWTADCRLISVKVECPALERELEAAFDRRSGTPPALGAGFCLASGPGRSWLALVRLLHAELRHPDGLTRLPRLVRRWRELAVSGLAQSVEHPFGETRIDLPAARRPRTVKRTLDAMHEEPGRNFTAAELAGIAGVGIRVLQESFRRHVGVPPLTYLRRLQLEGAHAELSRPGPERITVTEVAHRWGFTHLGRFAGAYREHYGVSPSETLRDRP